MIIWSTFSNFSKPINRNRNVLVWEENFLRSPNHTNAFYRVHRLRTPAWCPITPGLATLASASYAHAVPVHTQAKVVCRTEHVKHKIYYIHENAARYRCETCGKGFSVRSHYYDHLAAHTGVKDICLFRVPEGIYVEAQFESSHVAIPSCRNCTCVNCSCLLWI